MGSELDDKGPGDGIHDSGVNNNAPKKAEYVLTLSYINTSSR